jgi:hypothetical protein
MNERFKELVEQSTIQEGSHGAFGEPTINEYVDLEKFAELIVKECCNVLEAFDCQFEIESIKDHFEV